MKKWVLLVLLGVATQIQAQIILSESIINYGQILAETPLEKEILIVNNGEKTSLLLTQDFPREYDAHISNKTINPGDTAYLRWKFNPLQKGNFNDKITLWYSSMNEPVFLKIKGDVKYIDPYASPACPNFYQRPAGEERTFITDILVIDSLSSEPLNKSNVTLLDNGYKVLHLLTDKKGLSQIKVPIRYYYFLVEKDGYEPKGFYSYINSKNHRFQVELNPLSTKDLLNTEPIITSTPVKEEELIAEEKEITIKPSLITPSETDKEEPSDFSRRQYKANNLVFLVDVSGSMNAQGRLEILKSSMIELVNMMRPEDRISLVSYSRNASIILNPTSGKDKELIISEIRNLRAQGATSGEKGLKAAYKSAKNGFISGGNNRVYIATDGVFKVSEVEAINKLVTKNTRRKILLSVLGIRGTEFSKRKLSELAQKGAGEFVALDNFDNAPEKLKILVKNQSKKF